MRKIYVASSWRNEYQPSVVQDLRVAGHEVYDFRSPSTSDGDSRSDSRPFKWNEVDELWEIWDEIRYIQALQHPISQQGYEADWRAMQWADTCVLVLPCGRSAHLEAGYFVGAGKELYIINPGGYKYEPELMYKMAYSSMGGIVLFMSNLLPRLEEPVSDAHSESCCACGASVRVE